MKGSLILVIIVLAVVGFFGYNYIQQPQTASNIGQSIEDSAAKTTGYVQKQAKAMAEKTQDMSESAKAKAATMADKTAKAMDATKDKASQIADKTAKVMEDTKAGASKMADKTAKVMEDTKAGIGEMAEKAKAGIDTSGITKTLEKAESKMGETLAKAGDSMEKAGEKMQEQAKIDTPELEKGAEDLAEKIKSLINKAKAELEKGDLKQATQTAQEALKLDPSSVDAKNILASAQEKIAAMAKDKAGEFATGLSDKIGDTESALGSLGQ